MPNNLTDDFIVNSTLELITIDWNLSGFTIILFVLNQFIAVSHSFRNISESSVKCLLPTDIVLSSAKLQVQHL